MEPYQYWVVFLFFYFDGVNRRGREVAAQNALLNIKKECENNYMYSLPLFYENIRLQKYSIISNGQNSCYGDSITGLVTAVPEEKDLSPYYHYNFNDGELSCSYKNGEKFLFVDKKRTKNNGTSCLMLVTVLCFLFTKTFQ